MEEKLSIPEFLKEEELTPDEIRTTTLSDFASAELACAYMLREVAAQLAELNRRFETGAEGFTVYADNDTLEATVKRIADKIAPPPPRI